MPPIRLVLRGLKKGDQDKVRWSGSYPAGAVAWAPGRLFVRYRDRTIIVTTFALHLVLLAVGNSFFLCI